MSRSPAKSGKATAMKSLKEKWLSMVQLVGERGENGIGGSSTVTESFLRGHFIFLTRWELMQLIVAPLSINAWISRIFLFLVL